MRNKLFLFATFFLVAMTALAQSNQKYENKFVSIDIPDGWIVQPMDLGVNNLEMIVFTNMDGSNLGIILGTEGEQNPMTALENQLNTPGNAFLYGAKTETPIKTKFLGKPATAVNFSNEVYNKPYRGTIYVFNENGCCYVAMGAYQAGKQSKLPQIWRSLKWKNYVRQEDNRSLDEYMQDYCSGLTSIIAQNGGIQNGAVTMTAISYDAATRCLSRTFKDESTDISGLDQSTLQNVRSVMDVSCVQAVLTDAETSEVLQRCVDSGITFKMTYYDKNDNYIHTVTVTAAQYKK